jgi:hypothetical protein
MASLVASLAVLIVCVAVVMHWRGRQYETLRADRLGRQAEVFRRALPGQRLPDQHNIRGRLLSEGQKLAEQNRAVSALVHLREVLNSLPENLRYRVLDLNIDADAIRLRGQATSQAVAEQVAVALRQSGGFDVEPPQWNTVRPGVVNFSLVARPKPDSGLLKESVS